MKKNAKKSVKSTTSKAKFSLSTQELNSLTNSELVQVSGGLLWPGTLPGTHKQN